MLLAKSFLGDCLEPFQFHLSMRMPEHDLNYQYCQS